MWQAKKKIKKVLKTHIPYEVRGANQQTEQPTHFINDIVLTLRGTHCILGYFTFVLKLAHLPTQ
jgi:hypothetical protein